MKHLVLAAKLIAWAYLTYLFVFLLTSYGPAEPAFRPPFGLFVMDTINLFIHEAGHLFFKFFGMWMHIIAGSLFQVLLPAALLAVTARQRISGIGWPAFWVGESLINVSAYIRDAPDRKLKLIAKGLIHDWNWLLSGNLEAASLWPPWCSCWGSSSQGRGSALECISHSRPIARTPPPWPWTDGIGRRPTDWAVFAPWNSPPLLVPSVPRACPPGAHPCFLACSHPPSRRVHGTLPPAK